MAKNRFSTPSRRTPRQKKPDKTGSFSKVKRIFLILIYIGMVCSIAMVFYLYHLSQNLPTLDELIEPDYDLPTQIYDRNGELITEFYTKRRVLIPFEKVPKVMVNALLAIEDSRFYYHFGIDPIRMAKALIVDIIQGRYAQGASTLTQQTAKMFLLSSDKKLVRKLKEILLALKIEAQFTKNQILELYLNKTYFGHGAHGIEAAAQAYFSKSAQYLNLAEAAMIAGMPQRPSEWAPTYSMENATRRRNIVLKQMEVNGYISREERIQTIVSPILLNLNQKLEYNETSYYTEHVRRYLYEKYGEEQLYRGGLKVYTMMDLKMQAAAQNSIRDGLIEHDRRQGYRGPVKNLLQEVDSELSLYNYDEERGWDFEKFSSFDEDSKSLAKQLYSEKIEATLQNNHFVIGGNVLGIVTNVDRYTVEVNLGKFQGSLQLASMRWARPVNYDIQYLYERLSDFNEILKIGDVVNLEIVEYDHVAQEFSLVLTQKPIANGGFLAMNPQTGEVSAMAGGYDFRESEFNRAIQGKRQTGSAFKPIVYSLALDNSFTPSTMLDDTPLVDGQYKPENYSKRFAGKMPLREALVHSKNIPSLRLIKELGVEPSIAHARKFGIESEIENDLTIVLGSSSLTLKEMVVSFSIFANGGKRIEPVFVSKIVDKNGRILEEWENPEPEQVLSKEAAFLMTDMLQDVVRRGTGVKAQAINRPSAGKTGTTDRYIDAWYIGYIPQLIAGVYIGFDNVRRQQTLGEVETGSRAALPIWVEFMKKVTPPMPILPFEQPDGITMVKINVESGLLDCESGGPTRFEYYKTGTEPNRCHREIPTPARESSEGLDNLNIIKDQQDEDRFIEEL